MPWVSNYALLQVKVNYMYGMLIEDNVDYIMTAIMLLFRLKFAMHW